MLSKEKSSSGHGFNHVHRSLKVGEMLPRLPSLIEQVMACRFDLPSSGDEIEDEDECLDEDIADFD